MQKIELLSHVGDPSLNERRFQQRLTYCNAFRTCYSAYDGHRLYEAVK
jgi:hypothetical protein